jgi:hypothetical protein
VVQAVQDYLAQLLDLRSGSAVVAAEEPITHTTDICHIELVQAVLVEEETVAADFKIVLAGQMEEQTQVAAEEMELLEDLVLSG